MKKTYMDRLMDEIKKYVNAVLITFFIAIYLDIFISYKNPNYKAPVCLMLGIIILAIYLTKLILDWRVKEKNKLLLREILYWNWFIKKICKVPEGQIINKWQSIVYMILFPLRYYISIKHNFYDYDWKRNIYKINGIEFSGNTFINGLREGNIIKVVKVDNYITIKQLNNELQKDLAELEENLNYIFDSSYIRDRIKDEVVDLVKEKVNNIKKIVEEN